MIVWHPMERLPQGLKDGRYVLLWDPAFDLPVIGEWRKEGHWWVATFQDDDDTTRPSSEFSHFAMIEKPT
jgi:hypothetical protein